jgi:hypothetical protein
MKKSQNQTAPRLAAVETAINNALATPDILTKLTEHGYGQAKLQGGLLLHSTALGKVNEGAIHVGICKACTAEARQAREALAYSGMVQVSRALVRNDDGALTTLGLVGETPRERTAFLERARKLFNTTAYTPAMKAKLSEHGYNDAKLSAERAKIEAVETVNRQNVSAQGAAKLSTQDKKSAVKAATDWFRDFRAIAKVALKEKPQLLDKLGLRTRTTKTKAQREAPRKAAETRQKKSIAKLAA